MNRTRSAVLGATLAAGFLILAAAPASAHASNVSHAESCAADGTTTTVVTFDNDYDLAADVTYRWDVETPGTAHLAAKTGAANPTVSLPAHAPGAITWHVTWSDNFRQPAQGDSALTILPLTGCHAATTTTTTAPATTTTTAPSTTTTTAKAAVGPTTTTTAAPAVLATTDTKQLPRTGSPIALAATIGIICLLLGGALLYAWRAEKS